MIVKFAISYRKGRNYYNEDTIAAVKNRVSPLEQFPYAYVFESLSFNQII